MLDKDKIFINFKILPPVKEDEIKEELKTKPKQNIDNFILWCLRYLDFVEFCKSMATNHNGEFDYDDVVLSGKLYINKKAYSYIKYIDVSKKRHINSIKKHKHPDFGFCLYFCIEHYKELEIYERCAFLQNIKDILENNLEE